MRLVCEMQTRNQAGSSLASRDREYNQAPCPSAAEEGKRDHSKNQARVRTLMN